MGLDLGFTFIIIRGFIFGGGIEGWDLGRDGEKWSVGC